jgi:hypothetical protein
LGGSDRRPNKNYVTTGFMIGTSQQILVISVKIEEE